MRAENKRFSLGRATVNQLVIAEDDLDSWELNSQQKEIQVRQLAWEVQKLSGQLYANIREAAEQMMTKEMQQ